MRINPFFVLLSVVMGLGSCYINSSLGAKPKVIDTINWDLSKSNHIDQTDLVVTSSSEVIYEKQQVIVDLELPHGYQVKQRQVDKVIVFSHRDSAPDYIKSIQLTFHWLTLAEAYQAGQEIAGQYNLDSRTVERWHQKMQEEPAYFRPVIMYVSSLRDETPDITLQLLKGDSTGKNYVTRLVITWPEPPKPARKD